MKNITVSPLSECVLGSSRKERWYDIIFSISSFSWAFLDAFISYADTIFNGIWMTRYWNWAHTAAQNRGIWCHLTSLGVKMKRRICFSHLQQCLPHRSNAFGKHLSKITHRRKGWWLDGWYSFSSIFIKSMAAASTVHLQLAQRWNFTLCIAAHGASLSFSWLPTALIHNGWIVSLLTDLLDFTVIYSGISACFTLFQFDIWLMSCSRNMNIILSNYRLAFGNTEAQQCYLAWELETPPRQG